LRPRASFEVIGNSVRIGNLATSGGRHVPRPVCHAAARARSASGRWPEARRGAGRRGWWRAR